MSLILGVRILFRFGLPRRLPYAPISRAAFFDPCLPSPADKPPSGFQLRNRSWCTSDPRRRGGLPAFCCTKTKVPLTRNAIFLFAFLRYATLLRQHR